MLWRLCGFKTTNVITEPKGLLDSGVGCVQNVLKAWVMLVYFVQGSKIRTLPALKKVRWSFCFKALKLRELGDASLVSS
jgi:hypothetical protein